ncbi:MAG: hypothetical protein HXY39_13350 [Chloroflexi bacterium]|nr:hypothetical protein [Chloroflexota bacterium]
MNDTMTLWITALGGVVMIGVAVLMPRLRLRFGGQPWDRVFRDERLRRIALLQERLAQGSLGAMGTGFLISGAGPLLNLPAVPAQLVASVCYGLALAGLVAQAALIIRSRKIE